MLLSIIQFFGAVSPPPGVADYNAGTPGGIGIIPFISNIIKLITIIAGIWSLFNLIMAGFTYITSANDAKGIETAWQSIYMSILGLVIIVASFTITAIFSYLLFGRADYILNPEIVGV